MSREHDELNKSELERIDDIIERSLSLSPEERLRALERMRRFTISLMDEEARDMYYKLKHLTQNDVTI